MRTIQTEVPEQLYKKAKALVQVLSHFLWMGGNHENFKSGQNKNKNRKRMGKP